MNRTERARALLDGLVSPELPEARLAQVRDFDRRAELRAERRVRREHAFARLVEQTGEQAHVTVRQAIQLIRDNPTFEAAVAAGQKQTHRCDNPDCETGGSYAPIFESQTPVQTTSDDGELQRLRKSTERRAEHLAWNIQHGLATNQEIPLVCPRCAHAHVETLTSDPSEPDYHHHVHQCTHCGLRWDMYLRCRSTGEEMARQPPAPVVLPSQLKAGTVFRYLREHGTSAPQEVEAVVRFQRHPDRGPGVTVGWADGRNFSELWPVFDWMKPNIHILAEPPLVLPSQLKVGQQVEWTGAPGHRVTGTVVSLGRTSIGFLEAVTKTKDGEIGHLMDSAAAALAIRILPDVPAATVPSSDAEWHVPAAIAALLSDAEWDELGKAVYEKMPSEPVGTAEDGWDELDDPGRTHCRTAARVVVTRLSQLRPHVVGSTQDVPAADAEALVERAVTMYATNPQVGMATAVRDAARFVLRNAPRGLSSVPADPAPLTDAECDELLTSQYLHDPGGQWSPPSRDGVRRTVATYNRLRRTPATDPTRDALVEAVMALDHTVNAYQRVESAKAAYRAAHPHGPSRPVVNKGEVERIATMTRQVWRDARTTTGVRDDWNIAVRFVARELGMEVEL